MRLFKDNANKPAQQQSVVILLRLIGLEELQGAADKFYASLPKFLALKKPTLDKLLQTVIYRLSYAVINPKITESLQGALPIIKDSAGYFFITPQLREAIKPSLGVARHKINSESISQILTQILNAGLDAFGQLEVLRYLALLPPADDKKSLKESLTGIIETFSLSALSRQSAQQYSREEKTESCLHEITAYEKNILSKLKLTTELLYSLYFDITNLFLGHFSDEYTGRLLMSALGEDFPKDSIGGFFPALMNERVYDRLKEEKARYLEAFTKDAENQLYLPLALEVFRKNISLNLSLKIDAYKKFNELKTTEFLDYIISQDYRGYVNCIRRGQDAQSVFAPAIKEVSKETDDPQMLAGYIGLFKLAAAQDNRVARMFASKPFIELYIHAYRSSWAEQFIFCLRSLPEIIKEPNLTQYLLQQKSGELMLMLNHHEGLRVQLKKTAGQVIDFSLLYKIFSRDEALFTQVYPKIFAREQEFVRALAQLLSYADCDTSGISLSDKMIKFISSLKKYEASNAKEIIHLLKHFEKAQRALSYGYTPFSGNLEDIEDKVNFSIWFFQNQGTLFKKITLAESVSPYLGTSSSQELREAFIKLLEVHGAEFLSKQLGELRIYGEARNLSEQAFLRIVNLLVLLVSAKRLCRKREIVVVLQYLASTFSDAQWVEFSAKFAEINGEAPGDYAGLLEKYHAGIIEKGMNTKCDMEAIKVLTEAFINLKEEQQKILWERLYNLLTRMEVSASVVKGICYRIAEKHRALARFAIAQLEKGKFPAEVLNVMNSYRDDEEFHKAYPQEFF